MTSAAGSVFSRTLRGPPRPSARSRRILSPLSKRVRAAGAGAPARAGRARRIRRVGGPPRRPVRVPGTTAPSSATSVPRSSAARCQAGGSHRRSTRAAPGPRRPAPRGPSSPQPSSPRLRAAASRISARNSPSSTAGSLPRTPLSAASSTIGSSPRRRAATRRRVRAAPPASRRVTPRAAAAPANPHRPAASAPPPGPDCPASASQRSEMRIAADADVARRIVERFVTMRRLDRVQAVERPERVQPRPPVLGVGRKLHQRRHDRLVAALDEQPLRDVAPPAVRVRQALDQLSPRCVVDGPFSCRASSSRARRGRSGRALSAAPACA